MHESEDVERHLLGGEGPAALGLDALGDGAGGAHEARAASPTWRTRGQRHEKEKQEKGRTDDGTGDAEVLAPALGAPAVEERLERDLALAVESVVAEQAVVRRQREDDLGRARDELERGLLRLDGAEQAEQVREHDAVRELRAVVKAVDLAAVLGQRGERQDVVEVHAESLLLVVDVVDERLDVLLRALVEGHDGEARALASALLEDALVVLDPASVILGSVYCAESQREQVGPTWHASNGTVATGRQSVR